VKGAVVTAVSKLACQQRMRSSGSFISCNLMKEYYYQYNLAASHNSNVCMQCIDVYLLLQVSYVFTNSLKK